MADAREQRLAHTFVALADTLVAEFDVLDFLGLLCERTAPVDDNAAVLGPALADVATIGLLQHRAVHRGEVLSEQLQATLHWRIVLEQAKGVLAEAGGLDMQQAYTALRGYAHTHQQRLSELARAVAAGQLTPTAVLEGARDAHRGPPGDSTGTARGQRRP